MRVLIATALALGLGLTGVSAKELRLSGSMRSWRRNWAASKT